MKSADEYNRFLKYFLGGLVLVIISNAVGRIEHGLLEGPAGVLIAIFLAALTAGGIFLLIISAKHFIRADLIEKFDINEWSEVRQTLDFFTKDRRGNRIKVPVSISTNNLEEPHQLEHEGEKLFDGVVIENLGVVGNKKVIYGCGNPGDKAGPFYDDELSTYVFVIKGAGEQFLDGKPTLLRAGEGIIVPPGVERTFYFREPDSEAIIIYEPVERKKHDEPNKEA